MTYDQAITLLRDVAADPLGSNTLMHETAQAQGIVVLRLLDEKTKPPTTPTDTV